MKHFIKAFLALLLMTGAAWAQCVDTSASPDIQVTQGTGNGCKISTFAAIIDQSTKGGPIPASVAASAVKVGNFSYTIAQAGSTGFVSGWSTVLSNVSQGAGAATITATQSVFEGAGGGNTISLLPGDWASITVDAGNFLTLVGHYGGSGATPEFVVGETLGTLRNNFAGGVGFYMLVGGSPITVTSLGRWVVAGNTGQHAVTIYDNSCRSLGTATVNTSGAPSGAFAYASLTPNVTLAAGQHYYVMSAEVVGGDRWYDFDTALTTTTVASIAEPAYQNGSCALGSTSAPGHSYGFPSFKYH